MTPHAPCTKNWKERIRRTHQNIRHQEDGSVVTCKQNDPAERPPVVVGKIHAGMMHPARIAAITIDLLRPKLWDTYPIKVPPIVAPVLAMIVAREACC